MFKDLKIQGTSFGSPELSTDSNQSVAILLSFIDKAIPDFRKYYLLVNDKNHENLVSFHIVNFFNARLQDTTQGYSPYRFSFVKNPPQAETTKETDIGIVTLNSSVPSSTFFEIEAKRFSSSSNNKEYVVGKRGGIERFKRCEHGKHLNTAGMFGYIEEKEYFNCHDRINEWITELTQNNTDSTIDWSSENEKLISINELSNASKWKSLNSRIDNSSITLFHYFLNLVN